MNTEYTVYMLVAPNQRRYIGITCQSLNLRWREGKGYKNNPHLWRAIQKYGWDRFEHKVLYHGLTQNTAEKVEVELIRKHRTTDKRYGFNIDSGGNAPGRFSVESRRKMSEASKGKRHSAETRQKISEGGKGLRRSEETRERLRKAWTGANNHRYGKIAHNAKTVEQLTIDGELVAVFSSSYAAEKELGIDGRTVRRVCSGTGQTAGGYRWRYQ